MFVSLHSYEMVRTVGLETSAESAARCVGSTVDLWGGFEGLDGAPSDIAVDVPINKGFLLASRDSKNHASDMRMLGDMFT
jgi:hypothetical protein